MVCRKRGRRKSIVCVVQVCLCVCVGGRERGSVCVYMVGEYGRKCWGRVWAGNELKEGQVEMRR